MDQVRSLSALGVALLTEEIIAHKLYGTYGAGALGQAKTCARLARTMADAEDIVLVHDAVRPFVASEIIANVIAAAHKHGAAIAGWPAVDTVKQVERTADGAIVTATIPRERIVQAQTPQGALFGLLRRAFIEAEADEFAGTDEASLLERAGIEVAVVSGSARNFKITQPGDIELAEFYLGKEKR